KSTLFNRLTHARVQTADKLFTTLDSTSRQMSVGYPCKVIFSDTVGFIKKLPHQLVESFKSTLEEVAEADLLLHVVDCTDPELDSIIAQTRTVLEEINAGDIPYLMVYNKTDAYPDFTLPRENGSRGLAVSALHQRGLAALKAEIISYSTRFARERQL
ncbi:MAG: GTPase HflX, partial [Candidatus Zixiibacteriota bacterium]